jgi:hypothetical protein
MESDGNKSYICVHVDDMLVVHNDKALVLHIVQQLSTVFELTDIGAASTYLNVGIHRTASGILLHQSNYTQSIVHDYLDHSTHMFSTPLAPRCVLKKIDSVHASGEEREKCFSQSKYMALIGSLNYLSNFTRPDITHAVNQLCKYTSNPSTAHWKAAMSVVSYLSMTYDYGIYYTADPESAECIGYCDASFTSDVDTMKSVTGYCFKLHNGLISWQSKSQPTVALSTAEAEYYAMGSAGREAIWLSRLVAEINSMYIPICISASESDVPLKFDSQSKNPDVLQHVPIVQSDSMSAIAMVNNNSSCTKVKHIAKYHHWIREQVEQSMLSFVHVRGNQNLADTFTKFLPRDVFLKHRDKMGLKSLASVS